MKELEYYCKTCKCGYHLSEWKTFTLTDSNIRGGSYTGLESCPKGHN